MFPLVVSSWMLKNNIYVDGLLGMKPLIVT